MKTLSKTCSAQATSKSGRALHGTAAQLRLISEAGGWDLWQRALIQRTAEEVAASIYSKLMSMLPSTPFDGTASASADMAQVRHRANSMSADLRHVH